MRTDTLAKHDRQKHHYQVTKAGEVVRIISRNMAIKLYSMRGDDVPLIYHVWDEHGITPVASKTEMFNPGKLGIFVGYLKDMVSDYNGIFKKEQEPAV